MNSKVISYIFAIISGIVTLALLGDNQCPENYQTHFMLPLCFGVLCIFFNRFFESILQDTALLIIMTLYFARMVIVPFAMNMGDYTSYIPPRDTHIGVALVCYEAVCVFFTISFALKKYALNKKDLCTVRHSDFSTPRQFKFLFIGVLLLMVSIYFMYPSVMNLYTSIFESGTDVLMTSTVAELSESGGRSYMTLFSFLSDFVRILLPLPIFFKIRSVVSNNTFAIICSLPIILVQFMFLTATSALAIFCAFVDLMVLTKIYPASSKRIMVSTYTVSFFAIFSVFALKESNTVLYTGTGDQTLSMMAQAYFSGVNNTTAVFSMDESLRWSALFYDIYYCIPFNGTLFGLTGETSANLFNASNAMKFQIISCLGQSYYYFGTVFAPLIPCVLIYNALKYYKRAVIENSIWVYAALSILWLYLAISPIMYNGQIFLHRLLNAILPCLIMTRFAKNQSVISNNNG